MKTSWDPSASDANKLSKPWNFIWTDLNDEPLMVQRVSTTATLEVVIQETKDRQRSIVVTASEEYIEAWRFPNKNFNERIGPIAGVRRNLNSVTDNHRSSPAPLAKFLERNYNDGTTFKKKGRYLLFGDEYVCSWKYTQNTTFTLANGRYNGDPTTKSLVGPGKASGTQQFAVTANDIRVTAFTDGGTELSHKNDLERILYPDGFSDTFSAPSHKLPCRFPPDIAKSPLMRSQDNWTLKWVTPQVKYEGSSNGKVEASHTSNYVKVTDADSP